MHLLIATAQDDFEWCNNNGMCSCRLFFHDLQYGVSLASEMEPMSTISKAFFSECHFTTCSYILGFVVQA